jgi:hypothetical protein
MKRNLKVIQHLRQNETHFMVCQTIRSLAT